MPNLIEVSLMGHLGKDPETRTSERGTTYTTFSMAANYKNQGEDITTWFNVTCFGHSSNFVNNYLKKGSAVYVSGELQPRTYSKKDGTNGTSLDVKAMIVKGVGGGGQDSRSRSNGDSRANQQEKKMVDDLPF